MATSIAFDIIARDRASSTFNKVGQSASSSSGALRKFGAAAKVGALAVAGLAAAAGKMAFDAIGAASDLNEVLSKTNQIFGNRQGNNLAKWSEGTAKALGMSRAVALDAASTFGVMGKAAGKSGADLRKFATENTQLAADLASFNNSTPEEAITAIGAALRGESEPIRRFGVLLDDATLRNEALKMGLIETTKEALTPQQKALAAHSQIMKQTSDAQGDFERTSGGLANQQRILKAQLEDTQASLGQKLLPVAVKFATFLNETGIPALQKFGSWAEEHIIPTVKKLGDWVRNELIPPLRELAETVIRKIRENADDLRPIWTALKKAFELVGDYITKVWIPVLIKVAEVAIPLVADAVDYIRDSWIRVREILSKVGGWFRAALAPIMPIIQPIINKIQELINKLREAKGETKIGSGTPSAPTDFYGNPIGGGGGNSGSGAGTPAPPNSHQRSLVTSQRTSGRTASGGSDYRMMVDAFIEALRQAPVVQLSDAGQGAFMQGVRI